MTALNTFLNDEAKTIQAYQSGQYDEVQLSSTSSIQQLENLKSKIKNTNYIELFNNINKKIATQQCFVGALLKCSFDKALVHTSNANILNQNGIANGSLLIASLPHELLKENQLSEHFLLLRVFTKEIEGDTEADLWGRYDNKGFFNSKNENKEDDIVYKRINLPHAERVCFNCHVLGMFYKKDDLDTFDFTPQASLLLSASHYMVFKPTPELEDVIINTQMILDVKTNQPFDYFPIGVYRETEAEAFNSKTSKTIVYESIRIFMNSRTANFGNTRFGKSNLNKIFASNIIMYNTIYPEGSPERLGMLLYDENGEYYHDNTQDGTSLYKKYKSTNVVSRYTLRRNENDNLMLNFYLCPMETMNALKILFGSDKALYIDSFLAIDFTPSSSLILLYPEKTQLLSELGDDLVISESFKQEEILKAQLFWCLLYKAGFEFQFETGAIVRNHFFDFFKNESIKQPFFIPKMVKELFNSMKDDELIEIFDSLENFKFNINLQQGDSCELQFKKMNYILNHFVDYALLNKDKVSKHFKNGFMSKIDPLLEMFNANPNKGGYKKLYQFKDMHSPSSKNNMDKLIDDITKNGKVCILDMSSTTNLKAKRFYAERIDTMIFKRAEYHFSSNKTKSVPMILLNYEEAHNLFPVSASASSIYMKLAREGAKMQIGIIYNTQFITSIYGELKSLTENNFVGHINNQSEVADLANSNYSFRNSTHEIMTVRRVGYMSILTKNRRFPIRVQMNKFTAD